MSSMRACPPTPVGKTEMNTATHRSNEMNTLVEALARARMRRAPRWRSLPYRPARQVAAGTHRYR
jgi:hypothetical protein